MYKTGLLAGESIRKKPAIPTRNAIEVTAKHKPTYQGTGKTNKNPENEWKKKPNEMNWKCIISSLELLVIY